MSLLVLIPTYNERANIAPLLAALRQAVPGAEICFLDDNSPDGTSEEVERLRDRHPHARVLRRSGPRGLGKAYLDGFRMALGHPADWILCMDADLSHDPAEIPALLAAGESLSADLVAGSRYLRGTRIYNWPRERLWLSRGAAAYTRLITGMPFTDPTGGFTLYRRAALEKIPLEDIHSEGYSFQIEMKHHFWWRGFPCIEVPVSFTERTRERSKMNGAIIREAVGVVWKLARRQGFRRRPRQVTGRET